ncbi:xylulokinase [Paenisporosarcina indica]|uniref:xylulokinase n=1 Tax=Paenisporosarcina indica TaxID=650093 RepID=UPI00094FBF3C|nr:FGGY family carbohydrate kinase [Paenisporosarcina indica]
MRYLAGIDVGTTGTKVTIYDETGNIMDSGYSEYALSKPQQYWVELNPFVWWDAVCQSFRDIFRRGTVSSCDIKAIGVSSTNALVLLNESGHPVMPAIMQLDQRASSLVDDIKRDIGEDYVLEKTKNRIASGAFWGPTILWLKLNHENDLNRVSRFMTPHSFINFKLTNSYSIDHSRASTTMLYDVDSKSWDPKLCTYFGIEKNLLPPIQKPVDIIGSVTKDAAKLTGLEVGTPVIAGCMDSLAGHIGLGSTQSTASLILGSVGRICFNSLETDNRFMNVTNSVQSSMFSMTPTNSTGISYKWIKELLFDESTCKQSKIYQQMDDMASKSSIGARGLIYHPYISGERSPIWNPKATGSFFGMTTEHKKEDFIRAVLEGVGYSLAHNYKIMKEELGVEFQCLHASGGGAKSDIWLQTLSDILGVSIKVPHNSDSETLGVAILAGISIGLYADDADGINQIVSFKKLYKPNCKNHEIYQEYLNMYISIYEKNKNLYDVIRNIRQ